MAAGKKKMAGFDINLLSAELLEVGGDVQLSNFTDVNDTSGTFDYIGKGDGEDFTSGLTTSGLLLGQTGVEGDISTTPGVRGKNTKITLKGTGIGEVTVDRDTGDVNVEKSYGIDFSTGLFFTYDIKIEIYVRGGTDRQEN